MKSEINSFAPNRPFPSTWFQIIREIKGNNNVNKVSL